MVRAASSTAVGMVAMPLNADRSDQFSEIAKHYESRRATLRIDTKLLLMVTSQYMVAFFGGACVFKIASMERDPHSPNTTVDS